MRGATVLTMQETPKKCRVLVAEDDPLNVVLVCQVLESLNCCVTVVGTGQQALEAMQSGEFDLALLDYKMPELDGASATRGIRRWELEHGQEAIFIVGLTASAMPIEVESCQRAGMDYVLTKPFNLIELQNLINQRCARKGYAGH